MAEKYGIPISFRGKVGGDMIEVEGVSAVRVGEAADAWRSGLEEMFI